MKIFLSTILTFLLLASLANAAYTIEGTLSTDGSIPKAPEVDKIEKTSDSSIFLDWNPVAGVEGYRVYRLKVEDGETVSTTLISTITSETSYTDSGLGDGVYSYQVQPFLGSLEPELTGILPAGPVTISIPTSDSTPAPAPASGGGGGGAVPTPSTTPTPLSEAAKKMDTNSDNKIDVLDFNSLMVNWGKEEAANIADFDGNGKVDIFDFNLLMVNWTG